MKISKKTALLFSVLGLAAGTAGTIALQTHAADTGSISAAQTSTNEGNSFRHGTPPAAAGSVTAISGSTLTVTDKRSGTVYTVDTSGASLEKMLTPSATNTPGIRPAPTTISVSDIVVGDNVMVQGTVSGTTITATKVIDGKFMGGRGGFGHHGTQGIVSAVSGHTITLTGSNGTSYTIDASSASVKKVSSSSVSDIAVGDKLMVNGTISGTSITAKGIVDGVLGGPGDPGQPSTTTAPPAN